MLVLTRRIGETIVVGDNVQVTILGLNGNQIRVGVNAPKDIPIHRQEIYERIQKEKGGTSKVKHIDKNAVFKKHLEILERQHVN